METVRIPRGDPLDGLHLTGRLKPTAPGSVVAWKPRIVLPGSVRILQCCTVARGPGPYLTRQLNATFGIRTVVVVMDQFLSSPCCRAGPGPEAVGTPVNVRSGPSQKIKAISYLSVDSSIPFAILH